MTVCTVEDSVSAHERLAAMMSSLRGTSQPIGQAGEASLAVEAIRRYKPDVLILDIRMSGSSGIDLLQELKKDSPKPIVMILTNYPYPQYQQRCIEAGADFFFDKSMEFDRVPLVLRRLLQQLHWRREHRGGGRTSDRAQPPQAGKQKGVHDAEA